MVNEALKLAFRQFDLTAEPVDILPLGNGHINETHLVTCLKGEKYVLQKINQHVFTDVNLLMNNIVLVTEYLNRQRPGSSLCFLRTRDGSPFAEQNGCCYRAYRYVDGMCLEKAASPKDLCACGVAFGEFQMSLSGFDASLLGEVIPRFHDTVKRLSDLRTSAEQDVSGRAKGVRSEIDFYLSRASEAGKMISMQSQGLLKTRVTHNDTKLNNVILNTDTHEPLCVIDLDTVMPGLAGNDFGDCIRSGASTGAEDEKDLSRVSLDFNMYAAFARGFLSRCGEALFEKEIETLPLGAYLMTYECGARFLTDYLRGDVYFHTAYPEHNLVRARTQMKLVSESEKYWNRLQKIISDNRI